MLLFFAFLLQHTYAIFSRVDAYPKVGALSPVSVPFPPTNQQAATMAAYCTVLSITSGTHNRQVFCRTQIDGTAGAPSTPNDIQTSAVLQTDSLSVVLAQPFAVFLCTLDTTAPTYLSQKMRCDESTEYVFSSGMLATPIYTSALVSGGQTVGGLQDPANLSPDQSFYCRRHRVLQVAANIVWENDTCTLYPAVSASGGDPTPGQVVCPGSSIHAGCATSILLNNVPDNDPNVPVIAASDPEQINSIIAQAIAVSGSLAAARAADPLIDFIASIQNLGVVRPYLCDFGCEYPCYTPLDDSILNLCQGSDQDTLCAPSTLPQRCVVDIQAHPETLCKNRGEILVALKNENDTQSILPVSESFDDAMRTDCALGDLACDFSCMCLSSGGCIDHPTCSRAGTLFESRTSGLAPVCICNPGHIGNLCNFEQSDKDCVHGQNTANVGNGYSQVVI